MTAPSRTDSLSVIVSRLAAAQKNPTGTPGYSRWVNRPAGRYLAAAAFRAGLSPNQITGISALFTFAGIAGIALLRFRLWAGLLIAVLLAMGYALDSADGQLARLRGGGSPLGEWLDHMTDSVKVFSLHLAVAIGWARHSHLARAWLLIPLGYAVSAAALFFGMTLVDQFRRRFTTQRSKDSAGAGQVRAPILPSLLVLPNDYGLLCVVFLLFGWATAFRIVYVVLFALSLLYLAAAVLKWYREVSRMS